MALTVTRARPVAVPGSDLAAAVAQVNHLALLTANRVLADGGIGGGTTTSRARSNATITYTIDGEFFSKASTDNLWILTGTTLTAGQVNVWVLYLDSSGNASVGEGTAATSAANVVLPAIPQDKAIVGSVQVTCNSSTFVPGTTALNAGTVTTVYRDGIPAAYLRPIGDAVGTITTTF